MKKKSVKSGKNSNSKWFVRARGSYLPSNWQAWVCYLVAIIYVSVEFAYIDSITNDVGWIVFHGVKELIVVGVVLTWIAQQKS